MVRLPTSTHGLCWDREAARERLPQPPRHSKHRCAQSCPPWPLECCGREQGTRAVPAASPGAATHRLSSLLASCIWESIFGRALSHRHRGHLAAM